MRIAFADIGRIADWINKRLSIKAKGRVAIEDGTATAQLGPLSRPSARAQDDGVTLCLTLEMLGDGTPRSQACHVLAQNRPVERPSAAVRPRLGPR